jgi:hypothetical protein
MYVPVSNLTKMKLPSAGNGACLRYNMYSYYWTRFLFPTFHRTLGQCRNCIQSFSFSVYWHMFDEKIQAASVAVQGAYDRRVS